MPSENGDAVEEETPEQMEETEECANDADETKEEENKEDDRKMFARGLNWNTKADSLKTYCEKFGEVEKCEIKTHPNGQSRGFAFIVFKDTASVAAVLAEEKHELDSRTIEMKLADKREKITKVFVGGLSKEATDEQVRKHFETFGEIKEISMPMDANNLRRGFCFVNYETEAGLIAATKERTHTINGKECDVRKSLDKGRGGGRGGRGDGNWRGGRGRGGGRGGYGGYGGGGYGGYGGYGGGYGGYGGGYDFYGGGGGYGGYGGGWGGGYGGGGYGGYGGYGGGQQSGFGKQRGRGRGGYRPY